MKEVCSKYLNNQLKLEKWQTIGIICLIIITSGIFGWIYEFIFYYFNSGMKTFYWRGGNFLPWINIYATGALMILILTKKQRKHPLKVFIISFISTGILEGLSGLVIDKMFNQRFWNYNTEILNFGNIGGYVCLRSATFFALSALLLTYILVPLFIKLSKNMNKKAFLIITITLCAIILADEIYNLVIARILNTPRATTIYRKIGFNIMNYRS